MKQLSNYLNKIIQQDCLQAMKGIPSGSVDMVLCDLPYGTTQNKWDSVIPLDKLWNEYNRILKENGVVALTGQGVFTAKLILSNEKNFKYKIVWIKSKPTNFLNAKIQPLRKHEDICIFYKKQPTYHPQMTAGEAYDKGVRKDQFTGSYGDFKPRHVKSEGERYPNDVVLYDMDEVDEMSEPFESAVYIKTAESEGKVHHPTQKPVALGRYLIRTYTNPGDVVLDNPCGSGSFLIAALLEERNFIGIEKNENVLLHKVQATDYIKVCIDRLELALDNLPKNNEMDKQFRRPLISNHTLNYEPL
jgi:site-specific DNA-methyltransferase (adenine-specific)